MTRYLNCLLPPFWLLLVCLLVAGCMQANPLRRELGQARRVWERKRIGSYEIVVQETSMWHSQTYTVTVSGGSIASSSTVCTPAPLEAQGCKPQPYEPADYTAPGLFRKCGEMIEQAEKNSAIDLTIEYDPTYSFPTLILSKHRQATDSNTTVRVNRFTVCEP